MQSRSSNADAKESAETSALVLTQAGDSGVNVARSQGRGQSWPGLASGWGMASVGVQLGIWEGNAKIRTPALHKFDHKTLEYCLGPVNAEVKEPVFEKPKLKKSQRVQREIQKEELEIVELKKHELEKLALQEMVKYLFCMLRIIG